MKLLTSRVRNRYYQSIAANYESPFLDKLYVMYVIPFWTVVSDGTGRYRCKQLTIVARAALTNKLIV